MTGSGKTTLSRRLGALLRLRVIELDAIRHDGAWDATPFDVMRTRLAAALEAAPQGWVCEGNDNKVRDVALSQADTVEHCSDPLPRAMVARSASVAALDVLV